MLNTKTSQSYLNDAREKLCAKVKIIKRHIILMSKCIVGAQNYFPLRSGTMYSERLTGST